MNEQILAHWLSRLPSQSALTPESLVLGLYAARHLPLEAVTCSTRLYVFGADAGGSWWIITSLTPLNVLRPSACSRSSRQLSLWAWG